MQAPVTHPGAPTAADDNPTRAFMAKAVASGRENVALDVNPALIGLSAVLVSSSDRELTFAFTAPANSVQGNDVVGGGTLASMLDAAMAMTVLSRLDEGFTCATISLTVNMLAAGRLGDFAVVARCDKIGRSVAFAQAELFDAPRARLIATATASMAIASAQARPSSASKLHSNKDDPSTAP